MSTEEHLEDQTPLLRVVKGSPTEEELAALTLVVAHQQRSTTKRPPAGNPIAEVGRLLSRRQRIGAGLAPGPGSWRRARPR
ncbi:acyl-CoA carboxylase subunit epsilon [Kocuria sp. HSID16901]|uniref:acyl-CoA carboxylase subunit epsilon n=1 Tax=Kocuria sp. HSID16901 TaxID=2419505 RepID=UPI000660EAF7|nr:acyl-CoA carboxylase subunit epsilon [Kocuria sp. HSID16901]RUQ21191.1 acyl-CoA carboxylase subunit epsilon [Kocuria sp. HSID16901]